jgi:hypothetical protein
MENLFETFTVEPEVLDKWLPLLEGSGKWEPFVSACPALKKKDYHVMAQLLENTEGLKDLSERTGVTQGVGNFSPILIPMLRRVMPSLIGMQIFGTQPMSGPTGLIFALRAVYQNTTDNPVNRSNSVILTLADATLGSAGFAVGTDISSTGDAGQGTVRHIEGNNILVEINAGAFAVADDVDNATNFVGAETTVAAVYDNEALYKIVFSNYTGTYATATGEDLSTDMKEVGFNIETDTVTAKTRKLKAKWTEELEQDLQAIHNMNAERLLSSIASDEITLEMNREFINYVAANAGVTTNYDFTSVDGRWELEKYQNLMAMISRVKRDIAVQNRRGQGTFMIVSPAVLSAIETSGKLSTENVDPMNTSFAGKAMGMDVYVDIYAESDDIQMGYKGPTELDAGIFYCPYIPLQIRKGYGEEDGQPRTFFHTRYGVNFNVFGVENYYQTISVDNLPA